jgi:peroxiredoxin Q/BCP
MKIVDMAPILWQMARQSISGKKGVLLQPGTTAPDFSVEDESNNEHQLSCYKGKKVILWFFPKAGTPG